VGLARILDRVEANSVRGAQDFKVPLAASQNIFFPERYDRFTMWPAAAA
jgi:hypothetical protein